MIHYHYLRQNPAQICNEEKVKEKIEFYSNQPIKHSLFNIIIKGYNNSYTSQSLKMLKISVKIFQVSMKSYMDALKNLNYLKQLMIIKR